MRLVVPDAELLPDHRGPPGAGPTLAPKALGFCPVGEELWDPAPLRACECDRPCGPRLGPPRRHAVLTHRRQPLADRRWGDTKRFGNLTRCPPMLREFKRPLAARLSPGLGTSIASVPVRMLAPGKIKLRLQRSVGVGFPSIPLTTRRVILDRPKTDEK